jgi:hypothetical protein
MADYMLLVSRQTILDPNVFRVVQTLIHHFPNKQTLDHLNPQAKTFQTSSFTSILNANMRKCGLRNSRVFFWRRSLGTQKHLTSRGCLSHRNGRLILAAFLSYKTASVV